MTYFVWQWSDEKKCYEEIEEPTQEHLSRMAMLDAVVDEDGFGDIEGVGEVEYADGDDWVTFRRRYYLDPRSNSDVAEELNALTSRLKALE